MNKKVQTLALTGLGLIMVAAMVMIVQLRAQQTVTGDFREAKVAEIHDAQGNVLLKGTFAPADGDDDQEVERVAKLAPVSAGSAGSGEAEVEYRKDAPNVQEIEFLVEGVKPRTALTLVLDGKPVLRATADEKGKAEAEANVSVTSAR